MHKSYKLVMKAAPGKIKWLDSRDGEGVVKDLEGNEYYCEINSSPLLDFCASETCGLTFDIVEIPHYGPMAFNAKASYQRVRHA